MKIAYLIDSDPLVNTGVMQKIRQQSRYWVEKNHTIYLVSSKTMSIYDGDENILYTQKIMDSKFGKIGTAISLLHNAYYMKSLIKKIDIDILYMRHRLYMPFLYKILKSNKVVMEINSDEMVEYKLYSRVTYYYNLLTRNIFLRQIDAFVSVSNELKEKYKYLYKPIVVIANGIDTKSYRVINTKNNQPILVFIGTPNQSWQGLDKIKMMAEYFKKYQFYIIGTNGKDSQNLHYFGYLSNEEATKIINQCDIGIGTLSLYKKDLTEASPLKSRHYLACGLPLIYAYNDTDIPDDVAFKLKLENSEENLNYNKIEKFILGVFNNKMISLEARGFAEGILDYNKKEEQRLNLFKRILNEK